MLRIFVNNYVSKWISGATDIVNKNTSTAEMQNIPILLKLIELMNYKYNGHNSFFFRYKSIPVKCEKRESPP